MNDDLEERLRGLRPAALPGDLRRSLRSAEPIRRAPTSWRWLAARLGHPRRSWALAGLGLLAVSALILAPWPLSRPRRPEAPGRFLTARTEPALTAPPSAGTVVSADHLRGVPVDAGGPFLTYAVLGGGLNPRSGGGFHLEMPAGPIRLDCGYTPVGNDFNNDPFGKFNLNVNDSF